MTRYIILATIALCALLSCHNNYSETVTIRRMPDRAPTPTLQANRVIDSTKVHAFRVKYIRSFGRLFCDNNDAHLECVTAKGIAQITDLRSAYNVKLPIKRVESCPDFAIDSLTHSLPFLQPEALQLLHDIGRSFSDSIEKRTGHRYRIVVTSLLRTSGSIAKLRRRNRNAVENSSHQYGRTFDISYANYMPDDSTFVINQECMKHLLGGVLNDLRNQQRCLVKYERRQGCFHISTR